MKFAGTIKSLLLVAVAALSACGGGGGGGDTTFGPPGVTLTASTTALSVNTRSAVAITVRMTQSNGTPVANGTVINGVVNSVGLGNLSAVGSGANGLTAQAPTAGGAVTFLFQSAGAAAAGNITFSGQDPLTPGRTLSVIVNVTVSAGAGSDPRISFQPEKTQININPRDVPFFVGSPYISEVLINVRSASGQPLNDTNSGPQTVQLSIDPAELGSVSPLDDPATPDVDERSTRFASIFSGPTSGTVRAFVWSKAQPGTVNLRASFTDPDTGQRVEGVQSIQIVSAVPPGAASVTISPPPSPVYVRDSGGTNFGQLAISVLDGNDAPVPNPVAGSGAFNNLRLEILQATGQGDALLSATNAAGQSQEGATVSTRTIDGLATVAVRAGTRTGTYTVRATTDRADNNVDNGISDPVVGDRGVAISDGRLFNVEITSPIENALSINPVSPDAQPGETPASPDGSYSLTVAAIATDRLGNPVIPGTVIKFGLIDDPQETGAGDFFLSGTDGDPQESGTLFTAAGGQFRTAGGGAGPGDAVAIFGKAVPGNRDLEGARVVSSVNSATSLTVQRRFNRNDDTGATVDYRGALPYVIGRAVSGNIVAQGETNVLGVARTIMTYPVSRLGRRVVVWAQGEGDIVNGSAETVSDVDVLAFAGVSPVTVIANPSSIIGNATSPVEVCVVDALGSPLQGVTINFSFTGLSGTGSVDGTAGAGQLGTPTGANGCTTASVTTSGVTGSGATVVFSVGEASDDVSIEVGTLVLQARPSVITTGSQLVTLTLLNGSGTPQQGVLITGTCTAGAGAVIALSNGPGTTDANGRTTVQVTTTLDAATICQGGGGSCTFETADGTASTDVDIVLTPESFSPQPECAPAVTFGVTLRLVDGASTTNGFAVSSQPDLFTVSVAEGSTQTQTVNVAEGTDLVFTTLPAGAGPAVNWTGSCVPAGGINPAQTARIALVNAASTCTATAP
jgi:hypothetical protein